MIKILFFIESLQSGGKERRLVELIKRLICYPGIKIELVLTKEDIHYKDIFFTDIKIHYLLRTKLINEPKIFLGFYRIAKIFKPNLIHVWANLTAIYAIPTKLLLKIPLINNQITNAPLKVSKSLKEHRLTFFFSDYIVSNTYAGLRCYNAPKSRSLVIYNGFDFKRVDNLIEVELVRKKFNIKTNFVIGMVANFTEKKDYETFIKAANLVLEKNKTITFICIGSGDSSRYKQMVVDKNKKNILFLGKQNNVESIMNVCDLGVLITNNEKHGEGISNAILEFLALSKPVIATKGGGNAEIIIDKKTGYLINPKSPEELSDKICNLIENNNLRFEFGQLSKKVVLEKFDIEKMINSYKDLYDRIIKN